MINWFGPVSWNARICEDCPRCDIPTGNTCERCGVAFTATDSGITMPFLGAPGDSRSVAAFHLDCHLKSVLPHTMWPTMGLKPDLNDIVDGVFECKSCGMRWEEGRGWRGTPS